MHTRFFISCYKTCYKPAGSSEDELQSEREKQREDVNDEKQDLTSLFDDFRGHEYVSVFSYLV